MRQSPTGTVTFLFTDMEGSTKLWQDHPDQMRPALARHDQLLREAITKNGGYVFKTVGDSFCAAFATAPEALTGALAAQLSLSAEPWPQGVSVQVRMALHTGSAEERDGDYYGPPLNRVARLLAAGHGGQTLLSLATQELTRDTLPPEVTLLDLGDASLKDLSRPERVFHLLHPSLPSEFPPLRSLDNPAFPNNLPQQPTSFIGRENEIAKVRALAQKSRLVTLAGSGGAGKSRLALQVAADLLDQFPDGAWLVELAPLTNPALVPQAVAAVLAVREEPGKPLAQTLVDWLKARRLLLILDNCEHLVSTCASFAAELLRSCPHVHLLASSREPLAVAGEQTYRVPSLSLPDPKQEQTVESISQYEAVRLFIERAQAVQPSFGVTDANAPAVAQVCFHLDGIPLAIELAAARVRSLSVEEINARVGNRFHLLTGGSRTALPRQQTLRALIDWSYDLLTEKEKALLCRLSVFAGGWTLDAAETVCPGEKVEAWEVLDLLTALADKSLALTETEAGNTHYRLLETVRQYAAERRRETGEDIEAQDRQLSWALTLAEEAEPQLTGPEQVSWLTSLDTEHDNLRAALDWCVVSRQRGTALLLAGSLGRYWLGRSHLAEGRERLRWALAERETGTEAARAHALNAAGSLALAQHDLAQAQSLFLEGLMTSRGVGAIAEEAASLNGLGRVATSQASRGAEKVAYAEARRFYRESLALYEQAGDRRGMAVLLSNLGSAAVEEGEQSQARSLLNESLLIAREEGHLQIVAACLSHLGLDHLGHDGDTTSARPLVEEALAIQRRLGFQQQAANSLGLLAALATEDGNFLAARELHEEQLAIQRKLGNQVGIANALARLGNATLFSGDLISARSHHEESLAVRRELGFEWEVAYSLTDLGNVSRAEGDLAMAQSLYADSLAAWRGIGNRRGVAFALVGLVRITAWRQPERAARMGGCVDVLTGGSLHDLLPLKERSDYDRNIFDIRLALGDKVFSTVWTEGQAMTLGQAVEYALGEG